MKIIYYILVIIFIQSCSFDNKSGIWKDSSDESNKVNKNINDFKKVILENEILFDKTVKFNEEFKFFLTPPYSTNIWNDSFYGESNINDNFSYSDKNQLIFQSSKLSRKKLNGNILFDRNLLLTSDSKGNIIVYSLEDKKILYKYNFYKKKLNNVKKKLYYILRDGFLYVSDNMGYLYVYNYLENNIIWAKKFDAPFRSNLKIDNNKLFLADENNNLFIVDIRNGNILRKIPSEEILVKNNFVNNLSINKNNIFFLNTFGSLYSINKDDLKVNWFVNVNSSINSNLEKLFNSNEIKILKNNLIITTNNILQVFDSDNGSTKFKIPINSQVSPVVNNDYIFTITKNNYLVSVQISTGKIIYSYEINQLISNYLKTKKKEIDIKLITLINSQLFIFLDNASLIWISTSLGSSWDFIVTSKNL